jgi:hypothetical protein
MPSGKHPCENVEEDTKTPSKMSVDSVFMVFEVLGDS